MSTLFQLGDLAQVKATGERFRVGECRHEWSHVGGRRTEYGRDTRGERFREEDLEVPIERIEHAAQIVAMHDQLTEHGLAVDELRRLLTIVRIEVFLAMLLTIAALFLSRL